jgi:CheY-like chemotaxis protein
MNAETAKTKSIVFVEDNPVVLMAYKNRLQREGFHVEPALDGVEAMKILTQFVPDLVVLDLMLPRLNGVELLRFICADPRYQTVPVIVLSTNSIMDTSDDHVLERASKRLLKGSCTPAIMLQAIQELFSTGSPATEPESGTVAPGRHITV